MTCKEVAAMCGVAEITARAWAKKNGVKTVLVRNFLAYDWTDLDVERFKARRVVRGRVKGSSNKNK